MKGETDLQQNSEILSESEATEMLMTASEHLLTWISTALSNLLALCVLKSVASIPLSVSQM